MHLNNKLFYMYTVLSFYRQIGFTNATFPTSPRYHRLGPKPIARQILIFIEYDRRTTSVYIIIMSRVML